MLLCKEQQNPIAVEGRSITISEKAANAHFYLCDAPADQGTIKMYLEFFLKENIETAMSALTDEELTQIVEAGVKREFLDLLDEESWNAIQG